MNMKSQTHTTNPTRRKPIDRSRVSITIAQDPKTKNPGYFTVNSCELSDLKFPEEARISLWAYTKFDESHWDMGTIGAQKRLTAERLDLSGSTSGIQFRLDIYSAGDAKLLGQAEGMKPLDEQNPGQVQSLFDTEPLPLGNELWRLLLEEGQKPRLQINDDDQLQMGDFLDTSFLWRGLVLPEAIRQTLKYLVKHPASEDDPLLWQNKWKIWIKKETGTDIPDKEEEGIDEWANEIVKNFVDGLALKDKVIEEVGPGTN